MGQSGVAQRLRCFVAASAYGGLLAVVLAVPAAADPSTDAVPSSSTETPLLSRLSGSASSTSTRRKFQVRCERELVMGLKAKGQQTPRLLRPPAIERHGQDFPATRSLSSSVAGISGRFLSRRGSRCRGAMDRRPVRIGSGTRCGGEKRPRGSALKVPACGQNGRNRTALPRLCIPEGAQNWALEQAHHAPEALGGSGRRR